MSTTDTTTTAKSTKTKQIWVYNGKQLGRGRPSPEVLAGRKRITIPVDETYDPNVHGR